MESRHKSIFDQYNEKVIDRIYYITIISKNVNWGNLKIHAGFIEEFIKEHKPNNLRTLEKAQNFFEDVKLYCHSTNDDFINEVMQICFAIVVESIDKLYFKKQNQDTDMSKCNQIENRILNYLGRFMGGRNLMLMLLKYYRNEEDINIDKINAEYKMFLEAGKKANYYRTDEELKGILPNLHERMNEAKNLAELNKFADEYILWSDIIKEDNAIIFEEYRHNLKRMLQEEVQLGNEKIIDYGGIMVDFSSDKLKQLYEDEIENIRILMIKTYVEFLQKTTKGRKAFEYSYKLKDYFNSSYYRDIIIKYIECLYDAKSFPVGEIDETQYHTCYNIMHMLYEVDGNKFSQYCDDLRTKYDYILISRICYT